MILKNKLKKLVQSQSLLIVVHRDKIRTAAPQTILLIDRRAAMIYVGSAVVLNN